MKRMSEEATSCEGGRLGTETCGIGVICGEDLDVVLASEESSVRTWAIAILNSALEKVATWGPEANELLAFAAEVLWQFSGGEVGGSEGTTIVKWLDGAHPRGRQWSKFAELVPDFVASMDLMHASKEAPRETKRLSDEELPF